MIRKVNFKFATKDAYTGYYTKYKTKTLKMEIPVDKYGFILPSKLSDNIEEYIKNELKINDFNLLWHRIINEDC